MSDLLDLRPDPGPPPVIKWTGGKRGQAAAIRHLLPGYDRYLEPFLGGGAVLFQAAVPGSIAGDIYQPLMELWRMIQGCPAQVVADYRRQWLRVNAELDGLAPGRSPAGAGLPAYFYQVRERFNRSRDPFDLNFLMRTCVNGIARFNGKGEFNNSFHLSRRGMEPDRFARVVAAWQPALSGVEFVCQDYAETLERARPGDLVYLDPPYAGSRQRYIASLDPDRLFANLDRLNQRGVNWALSFDGTRGGQAFAHRLPAGLYRRHLLLTAGTSAVNRVLNGPLERVRESLYLNY